MHYFCVVAFCLLPKRTENEALRQLGLELPSALKVAWLVCFIQMPSIKQFIFFSVGQITRVILEDELVDPIGILLPVIVEVIVYLMAYRPYRWLLYSLI